MPFAVASRNYGHLGIKDSIRPSAPGKRNWVFIRHPEAGERSAAIYTLLGTVQIQGRFFMASSDARTKPLLFLQEGLIATTSE